MSKDLIVRGVPDSVKKWIADEAYEQRMSQNSFLLSVLENAHNGQTAPTLFDDVGPDREVIPGSIPFTFIDLFAGIGGFRVALSQLGGKCKWTCEYDRFAATTYKAWFKEEKVYGDINDLTSDAEIENEIPDHDILAAGFPCQPFSLAGVSKKKSLGQAHGFECKRQGNLFFKIAEIVKVKRPPILFLENVKNLRSHDKGTTWKVIEHTLENELGYHVFADIIDAAHWVPQHRERIIIVCFDKELFEQKPLFEFPELPDAKPVLRSILEKTPDEKFTLTDHLWEYLQAYAEKHRKKGNGFGYSKVGPNDQARTLSARYHKDGSEILIERKGHNKPRRLTIVEAARLMGFDEKKAEYFGHENGFPQVVSNTQAYRQFGNAVVPDVVKAVGQEIIKTIKWHIDNSGNKCLLKQDNKKNVNVKKRKTA